MDAFDDIPTQQSGIDLSNNGPTIANPEDIERQKKFREKEELRMRDLHQKQMEEIEAKNERKSQAKDKLQEMLGDLEKIKKTQDNERREANGQDVNTGSWAIVSKNIALKNGDYPGTKDISRMREAIVNRSQDEQNN